MDLQQYKEHEITVKRDDGTDFRLGKRIRDLRPEILQVDPMDFSENVR